MTIASPTLNPALKSFWTARENDKGEPIRLRILYGGRSSSKSWDAAGFAIYLAQRIRAKFLCVRQFQSKIEESVYTLLKNTIYRFGLQAQFRILENKIIHRGTGSEFIFYGLWRSINEIRGLEGIDICWIEEAHALTEEQWRVLNPTLRSEASQFWVIFNPQLSTDYVWRRMVVNPPPGALVRHINYNENPFLSRTISDVIEAAKAEDFAEYQHIYLGLPNDDDDDAIIKRSWVTAAIDAHTTLGIAPSGFKRIGFDVADAGRDKCAMVYAHGQLVSWSDQWKAREDELLKSTTRAWNAAIEREAQLVYDDIGVGAGVGSKLNELNTADAYGRPSPARVTHKGFNAGGKVHQPEAMYRLSKKTNQDMFANIKAQAWWLVADMLRNTYSMVTAQRNGEPMPRISPSDLIFLDGAMPNLTQLVDELCTPKRDFDNSGKVKVESKKDLDKRDIPSPNLADAFIMAFAPGGRPMMISEAAMAASARGRR